MTALSELLASSGLLPARAIERIEASEKHSLHKGTLYRYWNGDHPQEPPEAVLQALAFGFKLPVTEVRKAAGVQVGELGPYKPPAFADRLTEPQRRALDELIRTIVKEGPGYVALPAEKSPSPTPIGEARSARKAAEPVKRAARKRTQKKPKD